MDKLEPVVNGRGCILLQYIHQTMSFRTRNSNRVLLPFGLDYSDISSADHTTEQPQLVLPVNGPLTPNEEAAAKQSIAFSSLMLDGPFYTGSTLNTSKEQATTTGPDGIERYSDKYKKIKKIGRTIEEHPYQLEFYPDELYSVMGISNKQKKKLLSLSTFKADGGLKQYAARESEADNAQSMLEKLKDMAEDLDSNNTNNATKEDENEEIEEEMDDDFEEDDDDDYNAEKYFDDGDDDVADDGDDEAAF